MSLAETPEEDGAVQAAAGQNPYAQASPRLTVPGRCGKLFLRGLHMYKVTKEILFCYGHRLLNYNGKCRHPHGHNGKAEIELSSEKLDSRGMVFDFEDIKQTVHAWIDEHLDHKMLLSRQDPLAGVFKEMGEPVFVMETNPTAEAIARVIFEYAASKHFPVTEVRLWETPQSFASYNREKARQNSSP